MITNMRAFEKLKTIFRTIRNFCKSIFAQAFYHCWYIPEALGIHKSNILALFFSISLGILGFHLMESYDFASLFASSTESSNAAANSTVTSIFIGCVSMLASSVGLVVAAFVFLSDSLKEQAARDSTLQYIISEVSKKKLIELIGISACSIVAIVGSLCCNTYLEESLTLPIPLLNVQICVTGDKLFYCCVSLCVALLVYIIIFACCVSNSEKIIQTTARMVEIKYRRKLLRAIKKGSYPVPVENHGIDKHPTSQQFVVQFIKDVNQIETILKALCDNNIELNTINQIHRMKRGFLWYFGVYPRDEGGTEYQQKIRENNIPPNVEGKVFYKNLILSFFINYELLVRYKEALIHIDNAYFRNWEKYADAKGKRGETASSAAKNIFLDSINSSVQVELDNLLNYFLSFARLTDLSLGSSRMNSVYLANSDLTNGCYVNSNFQEANLVSAILKDCDLSCTNCKNIKANYADFRRSNLSHADFAGARLLGTNLSDCVMEEITFRSKNIEKDKEFDFSTIKFETVYSSLYGTVQRKLLDNTEKICLIRYIKNLLLYDRYYMVRQIRICLDELFVQYMSNMMNLIPIIEETRATITDIQALQNMSSHGMGYVVACLSNATISNSLMRQVDLSSMDLVGASFDESIMTGMIAINSNATGTIFKKSNLKEAVFGGTNFQEAVFDEANLYNAKFINVAASKSSFCGASMAKVVIANTRESFSIASYMTNETLTINESVEPCLWTNLAIKQATAIDALVFNVCMDESNFNKSIFKRAVIYNTLMRWSSFVNCDLSYTMLVGCAFFQSDFSNALLSKSILFASDFSNANMENTKLIYAIADKCIFHRTTFKDANLSDMTFHSCYFEDVSFEDTYISNTSFELCVFKQMSFPKNLIRRKRFLQYDNSKQSIYIDQNHNLYINVHFYGT